MAQEHRSAVQKCQIDPEQEIQARINLAFFNFARMLKILSTKTLTRKWVNDMYNARGAHLAMEKS